LNATDLYLVMTNENNKFEEEDLGMHDVIEIAE
jgi:hypothetical protein